MKSRNFIALLLILALPVVLGACAKGKPIELVVYSQLANSSGEMTGWSAEVLLEKFNVKFNIINEMDGTFATRMADGNLGDIVIFGSDGSNYQDAVEAGMLYNWEEDNLLQEIGPYIYENMQLALEKNRSLSNGNIYGFGFDVARSADSHATFFYYPYIRWDLYTQLGRPQINTLEDFIPVLEQMVALEPVTEVGTKTYGLSAFPEWDGDMVMMVKSTAALYGYDEFGFGLYDSKTQTFEDCLKEGGMYLRSLKFHNTLYQKGLLDPDSMTQTFNEMSQKYKNGAAFFNIFSWIADVYNTPNHMEAGKAMQLVTAADQKNIAYGLNVFGGNRVWTIGSKSNYPELCMKIINWLSTPEGVLVYNYGPKGLTWDYDEAGNTYMTELGMQTRKDKKTQITYNNFTGAYEDGEFQHNNTTWNFDDINPESASGESYNYEFWNSTILNDVTTPIQQSWRDFTGVVKPDEYLEQNGHVSVSIGSKYAMPKRTGEFDATWEQVKQCIKAGSWSAIYAKTDAEYDAIVAQMISDAKSYGYDECIEWCIKEAQARKAEEDLAKR